MSSVALMATIYSVVSAMTAASVVSFAITGHERLAFAAFCVGAYLVASGFKITKGDGK